MTGMVSVHPSVVLVRWRRCRALSRPRDSPVTG